MFRIWIQNNYQVKRNLYREADVDNPDAEVDECGDGDQAEGLDEDQDGETSRYLVTMVLQYSFNLFCKIYECDLH